MWSPPAPPAGFFQMNNPGNANNALYGTTNGGGFGVVAGQARGITAIWVVRRTQSSGSTRNGNRGALGTLNYGVYALTPPGQVAGRFEGRVEITNNATISGAATISNGATITGYTQINGNLNVTGTLTKGYGSFLIDHPLDPETSFCRHNFVESPENLADLPGKVKLDDNGEATVEMPNYFKALSAEENATVSLTAIGRPFLTGYEWDFNLSRLRVYGERDREVAWVVYADRDDPVIHALSQPVEEEKGPGKLCDRGQLLYPKAYGYPEALARRGQ